MAARHQFHKGTRFRYPPRRLVLEVVDVREDGIVRAIRHMDWTFSHRAFIKWRELERLTVEIL